MQCANGSWAVRALHGSRCTPKTREVSVALRITGTHFLRGVNLECRPATVPAEFAAVRRFQLAAEGHVV